ncbi:MAG: SDR family oxidoreductase [Gemmataceae bacterium]
MDKLIIGCGYLGMRTAKLWLAQGHGVFATTRSHSKAAELRQIGIKPIVCDILDSGNLGPFPTVETAVHCIALDRNSGASMHDLYVGGLDNVLAVLPRPRRFLYVSSTSVYGQTGGEEVDEHAFTLPLEEAGKIVLEAEAILREKFAEAVLLRFSGIYGPGRLLRRHTLEQGEAIVGDPDKWLNLIHVEDGAAAVLAAEAHAQAWEVYNIADDNPVRRREFYDCLARMLGAQPPAFVLPSPDAPFPSHERANRRIVNRRLHEDLKMVLRYPSYRAGLPASI